MPPREVRIGMRSDVPERGSKRFRVGGTDVTVFDTRDGLRAVQDECPHRAISLCGAPVDGSLVTCPGHGWKFDLATGGCVEGEEGARLATYRLHERGGELFLELP